MTHLLPLSQAFFAAGISEYLSSKAQDQLSPSLHRPLPSESILRQHMPSSQSSRPSPAIQRSSQMPLTPPWQTASPKQYTAMPPPHNIGPAQPIEGFRDTYQAAPPVNAVRPAQNIAEFPDFNELPAGQRAILKQFLTVGARQGLVDFSGLPRCPPWLAKPQSEPRPPPQTSPSFDLQPNNSSRQLRDLERRHSHASQQMTDIERQHSRASESSPLFSQGSYNPFSTRQMDSGRPIRVST